MRISVNGQEFHTNSTSNVADLVSAHTGRGLLTNGQPADGGRLGIAVVRNAELVPRSQWASFALTEGDQLEIVAAVQGG
ncbi:thiamine biosynthesis protein [Renibacterium salmoninarum ATCC 33209]|uniref:Thiamine biosynthesis protein n=1 Tax=Renibacterium salmoninarum (strain ATCC 33209 / DSM 20767 / JCM 11484 / NBRC 15589 / NCIMB 2235) TaxID=288705 RepID=A9WPG3_RENSM|nr:sulfur carrier protein ThiS [Renibacterium salmoninarum]ABY22948.1 thiamine biosynthesis protein [Renibacterium salmoninarum ATCC 33209]